MRLAPGGLSSLLVGIGTVRPLWAGPFPRLGPDLCKNTERRIKEGRGSYFSFLDVFKVICFKLPIAFLDVGF